MTRLTQRALVAAAVAMMVPPPQPHRADPLTGMPFVLISPGEFEMGTPGTEPKREPQERLHHVRLTRPFYLGAHEVTQGEWKQVMGINPAHFTACGLDCPIERVTLFDVRRFLDRLNARSEWPGFRLPTEAEWEYACRAGGAAAFGHSASLTASDANVDGRYPYPGGPPGLSRGATARVQSFPPNRWGLFDMSGNVWEWTADPHCPYSTNATDPLATCQSPHQVIRGGSWFFSADSARCGLRYTHRPQDRGFSLGVRLAHAAEE
jgi:formylglycine-generating enzyme required for sulfatase activity